MLLGRLTLIDVSLIAPGALLIGIIIGYIIRARYNGKEDK